MSRQSECTANLRQIGLALYNYHKDWGSFPPAYVANEERQPIYGWRILLLPYLDRAALYNAYRFREPWDGPNNMRFHGEGVPAFACPTSSDNSRSQTSYVPVVGPTT